MFNIGVYEYPAGRDIRSIDIAIEGCEYLDRQYILPPQEYIGRYNITKFNICNLLPVLFLWKLGNYRIVQTAGGYDRRPS
jgi:hypothetical protein